ncbi:PTS system transporter subunit IIA [Bacillus sp. TS-2]|nr:PTS system transporter subunit IIA [Bacillus sp. TS-2]
MLKKWLGLDKNKSKDETVQSATKAVKIYAPISGTYMNIEEVPDPTFSQKMMGDGFAIKPEEGQVVSPIDGEIVQVFPTKHAIGLKSNEGVEVLIHVGLETVNMKGEGFVAHVSEGDKVSVGDVLLDFDLALIGEKAESTITPVVLTNQDELSSIEKLEETTLKAGETIIIQAVK